MFYKTSNEILVDIKKIPHLVADKKTNIYRMKYLKLKKIKVAKINHLNMIFGGNDRETIVQGCLPYTLTCPPKKTQDPYNTSCQTTNGGTTTLGNVTGAYAETDQCGG